MHDRAVRCDVVHNETNHMRITTLFTYVVLAMPMTTFADEAIFEGDGIPQLVIEKGAGEGPAWHPELGLLSSGGGDINIWKDGKSRVFLKNAGSNGLLFDRKGRLLICEPVKRRVSRLTLDGSLEVLTANYEGKTSNTSK